MYKQGLALTYINTPQYPSLGKGLLFLVMLPFLNKKKIAKGDLGTFFMYNDIRSFVNLSGNNIIGLDYLVFCDSPIQYRTEHFENPGWYVGVPKL